MRVSEQFQKVLGVTMGAALVIAAALFIAECVNPPSKVGAQNSGTVGLYTREVSVFSAQASTTSSAIFPDNGYAANFLSYCNSSFIGSIDLEWRPQGSTGAYLPLSTATYSITDSACHVLQVGGYFPNLRSTVTVTSGSLSAWYTASAGPIPLFASGLGSNGQASPIVCDQSNVIAAGTGTTFAIAPLNSGDTVVVCNFFVSFNGATSAGNLSLEFAINNSCGSPSITWSTYTTANTPQAFPVPVSQRSDVYGRQNLCILNSSGAIADVSLSWASVHL